jgi:tripartite-type tricarboxylate transporter receptor subunit TctC
MPMVNGGEARIIVNAASQRTPNLPDIPTVRETGHPSLELDGLSGLFGPAKMPAEIRKRIGADVVTVMSDETLLSRLSSTGQVPMPGGPDELAESVKRQIGQIEATARLLGLKRKS